MNIRDFGEGEEAHELLLYVFSSSAIAIAFALASCSFLLLPCLSCGLARSCFELDRLSFFITFSIIKRSLDSKRGRNHAQL